MGKCCTKTRFLLNWRPLFTSDQICWTYHRHTVWPLRHGILRIRKCAWWPLVAIFLTNAQCLQTAWKWSKVPLLCNCTAHTALICSLAGENKPRGSSSLNKDTTRLPHGVWKANLVQTGGQAAERGPLGFLFSSYWKIPPVTDQELHLWGFTGHMKSLPSINSPIIPSERPFSICVSFSLTHNDPSFRRTLADRPTEQLYCIQRMQWLYSELSCLLLIFYSYLHLCLSLWNTSQHQPGLVSSTQWLQHQHPPPDKEADRKTERRRH